MGQEVSGEAPTKAFLASSELATYKAMSSFSEGELKRLHRRFAHLDKDGSGTLTTDEFLAIPQLAVNPLLERIISIFDTNKDNEIEFSEFIEHLATFTENDPMAKLKFAFQVYDIDNDGYISNGELYSVLKMMVGSNLTDVQLQQIVDKTIMQGDKTGDGKLSFEEFASMIENAEDLAKKMTVDFSG